MKILKKLFKAPAYVSCAKLFAILNYQNDINIKGSLVSFIIIQYI